MFLILALVTLFIVVYFYDRSRFQHFVTRGVKQGVPAPFFGDQFELFFRTVPFCETLMKLYNRFDNVRYSGIYQFYLPVLMIKDPKLIKQICVKDFEHFLDHQQFTTDEVDPLWNKNLFALKGQKWKEMRSTLSPSFTGSKMRQIFVLMHECSKNFVDYFVRKPEEIIEIDLKDVFTRYTNDIIASTAFGIHCDSLKDRDNTFYINGQRATDFSGWWKNMKFFIIALLPSNISKLFFTGSFFEEDVSNFFRGIVRDSLKYREENKIERPDLLQLLMQARKGHQVEEAGHIEEGNFAAVEEHLEMKVSTKGKLDLSLDDITSQALIFFFAGFETVSTVMCLVAHELAVNPDIQKRLIKELDELRDSKDKFSYESLAKLPYLDMIVSETLRKWPPSLTTDRHCNKRYTIKPELPGEEPVQIEVDEIIWIPIWAIHHDPKYWENPEKFDPERFSPENKHKIDPYTYLPFGVGPRNCIGSRFAITEVKVVFYELLAHFEIVPTEKSSIPFVPNRRTFNLTSATGFWFGLKKRDSRAT